MTTRLTKPVSRTVPDRDGKDVVVTITATDVEWRYPRRRTANKRIPHGSDETDITKPVTRVIADERGTLSITVTSEGIVYRDDEGSFLLPHRAGQTRAQVLANGGIGMASDRPRKRANTQVNRGVLATSRNIVGGGRGKK